MPKPIRTLLTLLTLSAATTSAHADNHGEDGSLAACPDKPNCVSSLAEPSDEGHYIAPLEASQSLDDLWQALVTVLENRDRVTVVTRNDTYLHAEESTRIFSFTDDLEFVKDVEKGVIQMRSASRLGYYDFGANRDRLEAIREALKAGS